MGYSLLRACGTVLAPFKKTQLFWDVAFRVSRLYPRSQFQDLPDEIIMEPTNVCNLKCPVCPTTFAATRVKGFMNLSLFKSVIDEFRGLRKKPTISMNFSGEPLLNRDLAAFVAYAAQHGHETYISTNVVTMTREMAEGLIRAGLTEIHLCIDGITKEAHEAYRVGSSFERVKENIEIFVRTKRELGTSNPRCTIQVLITSYSEKQFDDFQRWAQAIGADAIQFKSLSMGSYADEERKAKYAYLLPTQPALRRKRSEVFRTLCSVPLRQAVVYWNGDLGLCCVDWNHLAGLPNIRERGFIATYTSAAVAAKRRRGFQKGYDICRTCSLGNADYMGRFINLRAS